MTPTVSKARYRSTLLFSFPNPRDLCRFLVIPHFQVIADFLHLEFCTFLILVLLVLYSACCFVCSSQATVLDCFLRSYIYLGVIFRQSDTIIRTGNDYIIYARLVQCYNPGVSEKSIIAQNLAYFIIVNKSNNSTRFQFLDLKLNDCVLLVIGSRLFRSSQSRVCFHSLYLSRTWDVQVSLLILAGILSSWWNSFFCGIP